MQTKKANRIPAKPRIVSVTLRRMVDDSPDTSWLGKYTSKIKSDFTIDRKHAIDCQSQVFNHEGKEWRSRVIARLQESITTEHDAECIAHGDTSALGGCICEPEQAIEFVESLDEDSCTCGGLCIARHSYRYFEPCWQNYKGEPHADIVKHIGQDFERMESLERGNWCFIGVRAEAEIFLLPANSLANSVHVTQTITSGGLWGIESDSESYIASEEQNQLAELREQLTALGFSRRAISTAYKSIERKDS